MIISMWCFGHLISNFKKAISSPEYRISTYLAIVFIIAQILSMIVNHSIYIGLFGENMRRNGILGYFSLAIVFITIQIYFNWRFTFRIDVSALIVGLILSIYGLMQISGLDFISWNNPYNAVISTVGNPNFAAAIMAIIATLNFGSFLDNSKNISLRFLHFLTVLLLCTSIVLSDARQGLISVVLGFGIIIIFIINARKRFLSYIFSIVAIILGFLAIFGMLQIGPLANLLYKPSVTVRGYYWDAGIRMFLNNPFFGIGPDRYGAYFKEYRDSNYSLNYGWDITSTNAHNVPIQIFATSGFLAGIAYLLLIAYVLFRAVIGIRKFNGQRRINFGTYFAAWVAYQAQSLISIDNLGISIWGWLLSGVIISLSFTDQDNSAKSSIFNPKKIKNFKLIQPLVSYSLSIITLILVAILYQGESAMLKARILPTSQESSSKNMALESTSKILDQSLIDPAYVWNAANILRTYGINNKAKEIFENLVKDDSRNLDALNSLAEMSENSMDVQEGIKYRELIYKIDPWNSRNLLQLGRNYKFIGNQEKMLVVKSRILSFDKVSEESTRALVELVSQ